MQFQQVLPTGGVAMSTLSQPAILRRFEAAKQERQKLEPRLKRAFALAVPGHAWPESKEAMVHASEPALAAAENAAKLHGALFPPYSQWLDLEVGSDFGKDMPPEQEEVFAAWKEELLKEFFRGIERSNFHTEIYPAFLDAQISIGALHIEEGDLNQPFHFEAIPTHSLYIERGGRGRITASFRVFNLPLRDIEANWPDAKIPDGIRQKEDETATYELIEALDGLEYSLWHKEECLLKRKYRTSPRIIFSLSRAAGETWGRGPVLSALGDIGSLDKVRELVLKNGSLAVIGMWQAEDDGVINLRNLQLRPGVVIPKAQGSSGLTPIKPPGDFTIAEFLEGKLGGVVDRAIKGPQLPPLDGPIRTATETSIRAQDAADVLTPTSLRLLDELFIPLVERLLDIMTGPGLGMFEPFKLDGRQVKPVAVSPLAKRWKEVLAVKVMASFAQMAQLLGPEIGKVVNLEKFGKWFLEQNGFPSELLVNEQEKQAQAQAQAQQAQAQQMMQAAPAINQISQAGATLGQMGEGG
jgi:hypothetical protein